MRNFFVSENVGFPTDYNVGIAPGRFDSKQLILSAIIVLAMNAAGKAVQFVRTVEKEKLSKCNLFINDDFVTMFPAIPSCYDISVTWKEHCNEILSEYLVNNEKNRILVAESVNEKICNLEVVDSIMEFYDSNNTKEDTFSIGLEMTLMLIERFINVSIEETIYLPTLEQYITNAKDNYFYSPVYIQGWRGVVKNIDSSNKIAYGIFPESPNTYIIESMDKDLVMKKYVKGMPGIFYAGRYFVKVTDLETAESVIKKLPFRNRFTKEMLA